MVLSDWQYQTIKLLEESEVAKAALIINDARVIQTKTSVFKKAEKYFNKHFVYNLTKRFLFKVAAWKNVPIDHAVQNLSVIDCTTIKKGKFSEYFSEEDILQIRSYKLDFILRFGFNIIRGEILNVPKYGVWSYHHGDELKFRGGPIGFWEIYKNSKTNGVVLQQLNNLIDAGVIINRRSFTTVSHAYSEHINKLLMQNVDMPLQVCKRIVSGDDSFFKNKASSTKAPMNRLPNNLQMLRFLFVLLFNRIQLKIDNLFKQERWDIGIIEGKLTKHPNQIKLDNVNWLALRKGSCYAADSFCFETNAKRYIVFEDFDYKSGKGKISLLNLANSGASIEIKTVIEKPFHLAYPFVFQHEQAFYLIPETAENGTVELYKWNAASETFGFQQVLINVAGVDSSIVQYQGRWWIFCGLKNDLPNEKLHVFYAEKLTGPYKAHDLNPVKTNPAGSRPAGQFIIDNTVLFRPAQYSVNWYGEKIVWFKIKELTPNTFSEEQVSESVAQSNWEYNKGLHTFSQSPSFKVIDAKKRSSGWQAFLRELIK